MATHFLNKFPVWRFLSTQIILWLLHYLLLATLTHLTALTISPSLFSGVGIKASIIVALFMGFFNGITIGFVHLLFDHKFFLQKALWIVMLLKALVSFVVFFSLISFVRYSMYPYLVNKMFGGFMMASRDEQWHYFIYLLLVFDVFAGLVISFINVVHNKYGPGVLLPLLLGKYRSPKEEERIFLFMDLKSSTAIAEQLGHIKYSAFIRDAFLDINELLAPYDAQVYQYVGDEIVITWNTKDGLKEMACVEFFFACQQRFLSRREHYEKYYGQLPEFKAGLHVGMVTAVEVGNIKKDIAYHGDTLNTTSRIQEVCNQYGKRLLVSERMLERLNGASGLYQIERIGSILLKGKTKPVSLVSVEARGNGIDEAAAHPVSSETV